MRLFCIPYAGGGEDVFAGWQEHFAAVADIQPARLPGRGSRFGDRPLGSMTALVAELARQCADDGRPLAVLGHSFGAVAAYALVRHLEAAGRRVARLFVGGARAPSLPPNRPEMHRLSDGELTAEIGRLDGTAPEVLAHADLMAMFLPVLRADFRCVETYGPSHAPVRCPITVMGGRRDAIVPVEDLQPWRTLTESACILRLFDGDHFFINAELPLVARAIRADLARDLIASAGAAQAIR